jgi:hypothetical protein
MTYGAPSPPPQWPPSPQPAQDPPTQGQAPPRGGLVGFATSLPGILTAVAALITAVTGAVGIYLSQGEGTARDGGSASGDVDTADPGAPVPEGSGQADLDDLPGAVTEASVGDDASALIDDCAAGDAGACTALLDVLAEGCYQGHGISCDVLYWVSAVGSAYEEYGATCGGRFDWTYVGVCSEL